MYSPYYYESFKISQINSFSAFFGHINVLLYNKSYASFFFFFIYYVGISISLKSDEIKLELSI